jgi:hypothetical protein
MLDQIHSERSKIALKKQTYFSNDIKKLDTELTNLGLTHPYKLSDIEYSALANSSNEYGTGGCCAILNAKCGEQYLYRYTTVSNLTRMNNWVDALVKIDDAFEIIRTKTEKDEWFPLSNAMMGFYKNRRGFSWWTNEVPDELEKLFKLGLVSDWVMPKSLVMRIRITNSLQINLNIPSAVDGYDQPIFLPKFIESGMLAGQTLNLNDLKEFKDGCNEFVVSELKVSKIEVKAFQLNVAHRKIYLKSIESNLLSHYKKH